MSRLLRVALLGAALLGLTLACLEGGLRLAGADLYPRTSVLEYQEVFPPILRPDLAPDGRVILRPVDPRIHWDAIPAKKDPNTLRVLCFGASATAGLGYSPNVTFPRQLEDLLVEGYPDRHIEVMNLGIVATAAKQIRIVFDDVMRVADPDVAILWCGSNEYLSVHAEKFGHLDATWQARWLQRLSHTYIYRAILRAVKGAPSPADLPDRDETASDTERLTQSKIIRRIAVSAKERAATMAAFQAQLEGIAATARAKHVPLLLCGEAVNDEWTGRLGLPADWMSALPGAPTTPEAAIAALDTVLATPDLEPLDRWNALTRRATAKDLAGDVDGATADWRASCNLDPHQRRSTDEHIAAVRAAAAGEGVAYFDAIGAMKADDARKRVGFRYFYDYAHLTPRGAVVAAAGMYDALQALDGAPRATAPLARDASGMPRVLADRLARLDAAAVDFVDDREFIGFCFDRANLASTDLWKYDDAILALDARIAADPNDWRALAFRGNARGYLSTRGKGDAAEADWTRALELCDDPDAKAALEGNLARLRAWRSPGH
ncbi:MAG: hypothetical protein R3F49_22235 [Planctomycetota bacterium]